MPGKYFSDREAGPAPRTKLEIQPAAWGGLVALIEGYAANGGFGIDFPEECPDGRGTTGTDRHGMGLAIGGEIPEVEWPLGASQLPPTLAVLDLIEFCHDHVAEPIPGSYHGFFGHSHLGFDRDQGRSDFRDRVNRILDRTQMAYELREDGTVARLAAPALQEALSSGPFDTGDSKLDELLETARAKFLDPDPAVRREALEKLWDAFERIKTLEPGKDKKASVNALLLKAADEPKFKALLEIEGRQLTEVGNTFHIRHSETNQIELATEDHVDYL
jgi:hypothetical protein